MPVFGGQGGVWRARRCLEGKEVLVADHWSVQLHIFTIWEKLTYVAGYK